MKAIPLQFNKTDYHQALELYSEKTQLQKELKNEVTKLLGTDPVEFNLEDALNEFYFQLELQKKEVNSLNLKGEKLAVLLGLPITEIVNLQSQLEAYSHVALPTVEAFTIYAETEQEISKYNSCITVIKAITTVLPEIIKVKGSSNYHKELLQGFYPMLSWNIETQKFEPRIQFIKENV